MEAFIYVLKWSEAILRWGHVLFAILWVGNSFLFNYLDNKLNKNITSKDIDGEGYLMHSGFFYKLSRLKVSPDKTYLNQLVIFKWQSYLTFVTGMLLLAVYPPCGKTRPVAASQSSEHGTGRSAKRGPPVM